MADLHVATAGRHDQQRPGRHHQHHQVSTTTVLYASLAGVAVGGPFVSMMGFTFLASLTLLLITSPLLIIFSPLLFCAAVVLAAAMTGFGAAAAMAVAGISTLAWVFGSFRRKSQVHQFGGAGSGGFREKLVEESSEKVKEQGKDWAGYLQQKVQDNPSENKAVRG